jgi:hypothetical protein
MIRGLRQEAKMPRKAQVQRSVEEKFAIVIEGWLGAHSSPPLA